MEDIFALILWTIAFFCLALIGGVMVFVRKIKMDQIKRQQRVLEQAKLNTTLNALVESKDRQIQTYQRLLDH